MDSPIDYVHGIGNGKLHPCPPSQLFCAREGGAASVNARTMVSVSIMAIAEHTEQ